MVATTVRVHCSYAEALEIRLFPCSYKCGREFEMKKEFEINLELSGIDLSYVKFLNSYKTDRDVFAVVIDKDGHSHDTEKLKRIAEHCKAKGYMLFLSNPCFEFWLLLHVCNVKEEYDRLEDFLENKKVSRNHTFTSRELSLRVHHAKRITEPKFIKYYLNNVDTAIKRVRRDFTDNLSKLIGYADASKGGQLGSNLPELFDMLREESQVQ